METPIWMLVDVGGYEILMDAHEVLKNQPLVAYFGIHSCLGE